MTRPQTMYMNYAPSHLLLFPHPQRYTVVPSKAAWISLSAWRAVCAGANADEGDISRVRFHLFASKREFRTSRR